MKKAIVTICTNFDYQKMSEISHPTIKAYAEKIGADFIVWNEVDLNFHPGFQKYKIYDLLEEYERILYLDTDLLVREDTPDLFEIVPKGSFAAFKEGIFLNQRPSMHLFSKKLPEVKREKLMLRKWIENDHYFNTGVMVVDREARECFAKPELLIENFYEQTQLNWQIFKTKQYRPNDFEIYELDYVFNRMFVMDKATGTDHRASFIVHFAGQMGPDGTRASVTQLMERVLESWKKEPGKRYKENIYILADGGIGDVVAVEPVARYLAYDLFREENILIRTPWVPALQHLVDPDRVKVVHTSKIIPDWIKSMFYPISLYPKGDDEAAKVMTHMLCHPTDFASISAFAGQIPAKDKTIQLMTQKMDHEIEERLRNCVIIHAGKSWQSKTFPKQWWQTVSDMIQSEGFDVALIGKDSGGQGSTGFLPIAANNALDLRNKLNMSEFFRAIELAPVTISNDSSPVHVAGAFDNWLGVIPTVKNAYNILPFRKGSQRYKTTVLSKKSVSLPMKPNLAREVSADYLPEDVLHSVLPKAEEIVNWLNKIPSGLKKSQRVLQLRKEEK